MSYLSSFLRKLRDKFKGSNFLSYGILKACKRCSYGKHYEPILIYSFDRGVRCIVNYNGRTYVRRGDCPDFKNCMKCIEAINSPNHFPCKWIKI